MSSTLIIAAMRVLAGFLAGHLHAWLLARKQTAQQQAVANAPDDDSELRDTLNQHKL